MTPPLTPAELHTAAISILDRIEMLGDRAAHGQPLDIAGISGVLTAAAALHHKIVHELGPEDLDPDRDEVHEFRHTLERVGDALEIMIRTIDLVSMTRKSMLGPPSGPSGPVSPGRPVGGDRR